MPEIVEVLTDAESLDFFLSNRTLDDISFLNDLFKNKSKGLEELREALPLRIERVRSRAKKFFMRLVDPAGNKPDWWCFWSYGMNGRITLREVDHSHIRFQVSHCWIGMDEFFYTNVRRIGFFEASCDKDVYRGHVEDMARPIGLGWEGEADFKTITEKEFRVAVKQAGKKYFVAALMDQRTICSGIGNYLLSELMYEAKLDPLVRCPDLTEEEIKRLYQASLRVIKDSYENGGVSMKDYVHVDNTLGRHEYHLKVYRKKGKDAAGREIKHCKGKHGRTIWYVEHGVPPTKKA